MAEIEALKCIASASGERSTRGPARSNVLIRARQDCVRTVPYVHSSSSNHQIDDRMMMTARRLRRGQRPNRPVRRQLDPSDLL